MSSASSTVVSRREFLATSAAMSLVGYSQRASAETGPKETFSFFHISDTHYFANKEATSKLDEKSAGMTSRLIDRLNSLAGTDLPESVGGGTVKAPRGVIHSGDLIESGDRTGGVYPAMQKTEWAAFQDDYGLTGTEGRLKYPVFEVHGNHDGPHGKGVAIDGIIQRNQRRPGLTGVSENGLHYSWNWAQVHFINLGIVVGQDGEGVAKRRYDPLGSLNFLKSDLKANVTNSKTPIVLTHHIDVARYCTHCDINDAANTKLEWHPCDVNAYWQEIRDLNVVAILYGHTHFRNILQWDGTTAKAEKSETPEKGRTLFNVDNSSHFGGDSQGFLYFEITPNELVVRECATKDGWRTSFWTPQVWRRTIG